MLVLSCSPGPLDSSAWRLVLDFSVFFFRVIFKYTATSKFDSRAACTGAAAFLHGRRILVYRDCTLDEPARVVKPHRKHAQNTTGEVRGEFQRRRVCACCRSRKTHGACALLGRFHIKRRPRLLLSLVETTITVDSHTHNEAACGIWPNPQGAFLDFRRRRIAIEGEVRASWGGRRWSSDRRPSRVLSQKMPRWSPSAPNGNACT
mgnify:CR=1 FL=1